MFKSKQYELNIISLLIFSFLAILYLFIEIYRYKRTINDLLTYSTMNPPPLNKSDNSFAQPNFDQYSVNMMYGSNTVRFVVQI